MNARIYGGIPLSLMMVVTLLNAGAAAGWWPVQAPLATLLAAGVVWACGLWLLWQADAKRLPTAPPQPVGRPMVQAAARPAPAERRLTQRFDIRCPVELDLRDHGRQSGELRDISQGGARVAGIPAAEPDAYGVMRIPGISLPVPFCVVGVTPHGEVRVRFELSGRGVDTFVRQLDRLVENAKCRPVLTAS